MNAFLKETHGWVREELDRCLRFWLDHGMDSVHGGIYTCLDRQGRVYSTDKSVWMQGRCAWTFSRLCAQYSTRPEWLEAARSCLDFMEKYCINRRKNNRMYFTVTKDGRPLRQRRYHFSEGFYAMANAEYYGVTGDVECLHRARRAYDMIWDLEHGLMEDPVSLGPKTIASTRSGRALADPMIYLNLTSVLRRHDPEWADKYNERAASSVHDILTYHRKQDMRCTLESVGPQGEFMKDITAGRMLNPGHAIECSWFMMEEANHLQDNVLHQAAQDIFLDAIEGGWDREYGGLLYFVDCLGKPPEAYEHDMKLWWPHNEIIIAALMAYRDTGKDVYLNWLKKTVTYCRTFFSDPEYGEWYGYLRRDGKPTQPPCKGSTFKGPFHLPRMLLMADNMLEEIAARDV
jgi:N-acylglucosamine 2-epimerase